jgi:hypothetical protein
MPSPVARRRTLGISIGVAALMVGLLAVVPPAGAAHGTYATTQGVYRIPYEDGVDVTVSFDHHDHGGPNGNRNRVDMVGDVAGFDIVAAAGGWIRGIVDKNGNDGGNGDGVDKNGAAQNDALEHSCVDAQDMNGNSIPNSVVVGLCQDYNNYVWIEHPNGEWSKYTHLATGSVVANGWSVGDWIDAGEVIGTESDVGRAGGRHLHHEIALPNDPTDPTPFSTDGGFIQGTNIVPVVCGIVNAENTYLKGETYTANPCTNQTPTADAGGDYVVDEGSTVQFDGTGSTDPDGTPLTYAWAPATDLDDPSLAQPTFTGVDDAVDVPYVLTVYDQTEGWSDVDATLVTVLNVPPTVTAVGDAIDEAGTATVSATFTDPGTLDTHTATIAWGDGGGPVAVTTGALASGVDHVYGDDGVYDVTVVVVDDDGGIGFDVVQVVVGNVDPVLTFDTGGEIAFPGGDYQVVGAGEALPLSAEGSDAGSDDLTFDWSTGDSATYFNDGVGPDPLLSPGGTFPFAAADASALLQGTPGVQLVSVVLSDDDGGSDAADGGVIVTGTAEKAEGKGWWKHEFKDKGKPKLDPATRDGYLDIVNAVSSVFSEQVVAADAADVHDILSPKGGDKRDKARAALMVAWLQFASGAVPWDAEVPLHGGATIGFLDLMHAAEVVILDGSATDAELKQVEHDLRHVRKAD